MQKVLLSLLLLIELTTSIDGSPKYFLVAPVRFVSGYSNKVCISRFGPLVSGNAIAQVELLTLPPAERRHDSTVDNFKPKYIARSKKNFLEGNGGCFDLFVPKTRHRNADLHLKIRFEKFNYTVDTHRDISIQHDGNFVIIQTDKPLYRAGDVVKFRVIQLKNDLTPLYLPIHRLIIETPSTTFGGPARVAEWFNVSTRFGIFQKEYPLDAFAKEGEWKILVKSRGPNSVTTEQKFQVMNFLLPTYNMVIKHDKNIHYKSKATRWSTCVKYLYGEGVDGYLFINVKTDSMKDSVEKYFKINPSNPCTEFVVSNSLLNFSSRYEDGPKMIISEFSFQEAGTKEWKNQTVVTHIKKKALKIIMDHNNYYFFKPGLPRIIEAKVEDLNGNPMSDVRIIICKRGKWKNVTEGIINEDCETLTTNKKGFIYFSVVVPINSNADSLLLKVSLSNIGNERFRIDDTSETDSTLELFPWKLKTNVYMDIETLRTSSRPVESMQNLPIFLLIKSDKPLSQFIVHYVIVTRAGTIHNLGISSQCVHPVDDVEDTKRVFDARLSSSNCENRVSETNVYKTILNVRLTHAMCPYGQLMVYFLSADGDFVSASKHVEVNECFPNKITHSWKKDTVPPGAELSLSVKSAKDTGPALCLFGATNTAISDVATIKTIKDSVLERLIHFMNSRIQSTELELENNECFRHGLENDLNISYQLFLHAGLYLITENENCFGANAMENNEPGKIILNKQNTERTFFPDTWLWETHVTDSKSTLNVVAKIPDDVTKWESQVFCVSRSGIATSDNKFITAYKPLVVDFSPPTSMKVGEVIRLSAKIHNYLNHSVPILIYTKVTPSMNAKVLYQKKSKAIKPICIKSKTTHLYNFKMKAYETGMTNISIVAMINGELPECKLTNSVNIQNVNDQIIKNIKIVSEGFSVTDYKSTILCTNASTGVAEISWTFPSEESVKGSEMLTVSLIGDIAGPMSMNLDRFLPVPMGCGEQNMALMAYNLMVLQYSIARKQISGRTKELAIDNLLLGYQRQLQFRNSSSGAFLMFGDVNGTDSVWLTAFCVKHLSLLHSVLKIGTRDVVESAAEWLFSKQSENGCFKRIGETFHRELMGGVAGDKSNIALTAYVAISLIDAKLTIKPSVVKNVIYCLGALTDRDKSGELSNDKNNVYAINIVTYALLKISYTYGSLNNSILTESEKYFLSNKSVEMFDMLKNSAERYKNTLRWWNPTSLSTSIEATGYGVLSLLLVGGVENILDAAAAVNWLSLNRNGDGGFESTQDTVAATEASCAYRYALPDTPPYLEMEMETSLEYNYLTVTSIDRYRLHTLEFRSFGPDEGFKMRAKGKGCVMAQATHKYNTLLMKKNKSPFQLNVDIVKDEVHRVCDESLNCECTVELKVCIGWRGTDSDVVPEMVMLEIESPTGYRPNRNILYRSLDGILRHIEEYRDGNLVYMYLTPKRSTSRPFGECRFLYLVGPLESNALPGVVKVFNYYQKDEYEGVTFSIPRSCNGYSESADRNDYVDDDLYRFSAQNWTTVDSETDLEFPEGVEGPVESWASPSQ